MSDIRVDFTNGTFPELSTAVSIGGGSVFWFVKRGGDIVGCLLLLPVLVVFAIILVLVNPIWNRGSLFFIQKRMGKGCKSFRAIKFRTMYTAESISRTAEDPIEQDRITRLGRFLRKCRIDEVPQILNVLAGQMSLIGPRPDYYEHALVFLETVPGYRARHVVRPGISGLAQVTLGYVEGIEATKAKVGADVLYISTACFALEAQLVFMTIKTILKQAGV